jgi:hypothetical protein
MARRQSHDGYNTTASLDGQDKTGSFLRITPERHSCLLLSQSVSAVENVERPVRLAPQVTSRTSFDQREPQVLSVGSPVS